MDKDFRETSLMETLLNVAFAKGYETKADFDPGEMHYAVYCKIHRWLQQKHFIHICVMPRYRTEQKDYIFSYFVMTWQQIQPHTFGGFANYDAAFAAAIEAALKLIPDGE